MTPRRLVPTRYQTLAAYAWIEFIRTNPDGLANVGLMAVTLPVTLFGLLLTELMGGGSFVLLPSGFGYQGNHAIAYWPGVLATAGMLYVVTAALTRRARA